jgi:hypothetical protein
MGVLIYRLWKSPEVLEGLGRDKGSCLIWP